MSLRKENESDEDDWVGPKPEEFIQEPKKKKLKGNILVSSL